MPRRLCLVAILLAAVACSNAETPATDDAGATAPAAAVAMPPLARGFVDIALSAGIVAEHRLPGPELETIVDAVGGGAAFSDLDGDDWIDLVLVGGPRSPVSRAADDNAGVRLYRNLADGRFVDVTAGSGLPAELTAVAVAVADVDGDGDRDLYFVDRGPNRLFLNAGDGSFREAPDAGVSDDRFGIAATFFDMEGDGDLDLYVANYLEFDSRQTSYFAPEGFPGPLAYTAQPDVLYRNRGDGTFEDVTGEAGIDATVGRGMSLAAADFDDDGDVDLFVANDATENFLWVNDGSGRFEENGLFAGVAMGEGGEQTSAMAADLGDVNADGRLDLAVSDTAFGALYVGLEPGLFVDDVMRSGIGRLCGQYVSWGQNLLDHDNDGDLDLFVVNGGMHHMVGWEDLLLINDGTGSFADGIDEAGGYFLERTVGRASIRGDYDNDGDVDLLVTRLGGRPHLLRNDAPAEASWLLLDLQGARGRDAFGATVRVESGGRELVAQVWPASAYLGQSDTRLHFGLGAGVDQVDRVTVRWPDGTVQVIEDLPARAIHRIREGE